MSNKITEEDFEILKKVRGLIHMGFPPTLEMIEEFQPLVTRGLVLQEEDGSFSVTDEAMFELFGAGRKLD